MVRLGILGGTFDPIHQAHLSLADTALTQLKLDQVLFVPAGTPPHKLGRVITPAHHRLKMVELAIEGNSNYAVSTVDINRPGPHYSVDMLALLQKQYGFSPEDVFFIVGADLLTDFNSWHKPEKILELCQLAGVHRPGYRPDLSQLKSQLPQLPQKINWVAMPGNPISGTLLRTQIAKGASTANQIPAKVLAYIQAQKLYR